jgi:hypothetical protein
MALEDATNPMQGVSGPGPYAKRTDLQYKPDAYGEGVAYDAAKSGAPLAKAQKSPMLSEAPRVSAGGVSQLPSVGLYDKTNRPDEPVTAGIDIGEGPGSEVLTMQSQFAQEKLSNTLAKMLPYDQTGEIGILYQQAIARGM